VSAAILTAGSFGVAAALLARQATSRLDERRLQRAAREQVGLVARDEGASLPTVRREQILLVLGSALAGAVGLGVMGPVGLALGAAPTVTVRSMRARAARRRHSMLDDELASALQLVVGHLKIGRNIVSALSEAADVTPDPLGSILQEIVAEARLGVPVDEVLTSVADRESNRHLAIVASAVGLHTRHGGHLVEILENVLGTIEEEDRLRRDIKSITADGRLSAQVLLAMPPAMLVLVSVLSPGYAAPLFEHPTGRKMLYAAIVLGLVGWRWLRSLSTPKVVA